GRRLWPRCPSNESTRVSLQFRNGWWQRPNSRSWFQRAETGETLTTGSSIPPAALAALSAAVLLLLWDHRRANLGLRAAWWFLVASSGYGLVRSLAIRALSESQLGGAPYTLTAPVATLFGVPLQELLGWTVAVGLASYLA